MKKRILSILLLCCMVLTLLPTTAFASGELPDVKLSVPTTFDKTVDLTEQNKELKITDSKTYLIKGSTDPNWYFQHRIKIDGKNNTPHIFLDGVRLQAPEDGPAIELYGGASACLYFIGGDSELIGAENFAALQKNKTDGYLRVLVQTGTKLTCEGGKYGAGIGGSKVGIKKFSEGHGVNLHFGSLATDIYGGEILAISGVYGAGIGGGQGGVGEQIYVYSGKLTVRSVSEGAGIGGGQGGPGRFIYIKGGTVNAGSESGGAGIGSGDQDGQNKSEDAHHIEISGGTVEAWSNFAGAGIGGGRGGSGCDISITGGVVRAQGYWGAGIGGGMNGNSGNILIKDTTLTAQSIPLYPDPHYYEDDAIRGGPAVAVGRGSNRAHYWVVMQDQEFAMTIEENIKIGASDGKSVQLSATGWQWRRSQGPYEKDWGTTTELLIPNENGRVNLQRLSLPYAYNYGRVISKLELRCEESTCNHEFGWANRDGCHIWVCMKCGARDPAAEMSKQNAKHTPGDWSNQKQLCTVCGHVMGTDTKAPVLEGLKDGESYTVEDTLDGKPGAYTFTVSDPAASGETSSGIKSVTINGEPQDGPTYRLPAPDGGNNDAGAGYTVVATDNAGNETTATVRTYRWHHVKVISPDGKKTYADLMLPHNEDLVLQIRLPADASATLTDQADGTTIPYDKENGEFRAGLITKNRTLVLNYSTEYPKVELRLGTSQYFTGYNADSDEPYYLKGASMDGNSYRIGMSVDTDAQAGYYLSSPKRYTQEELAALDESVWREYKIAAAEPGSIALPFILITIDAAEYEKNGGWYIYAKATNPTGTTFVSTPNMIIDVGNPKAIDLATEKELVSSGKYWGDLRFKVEDSSPVTVRRYKYPGGNAELLTPDENGVYTIPAEYSGSIQHTLVIEDACGNTTSYKSFKVSWNYLINVRERDHWDETPAQPIRISREQNLQEELSKVNIGVFAADSNDWIPVDVSWGIPDDYNPQSRREQTFTVNGTLILKGTGASCPSGLDVVPRPGEEWKKNISVQVTVEGDPQYKVTVQDCENGRVKVVNAAGTAEDGTPLFFKGELVMLSIDPDEGYMLSTLSVNGNPAAVAVGDDTYTFTQPEGDVTITAAFEMRNEHTVTFDANGGSEPEELPEEVTTAMPAKKILHGSEYSLPECEFIAPENQQFKAWQIDGTEYPVNAPVTVTADITVKALWEDVPPAPAEFTITVKTDGNGTASASPAKAVAGEEITLTATPDGGYRFKEWEVISGGVTIKDDKFTMPDGNVEIKAIFEEDAPPVPTEFTITVTSGGNGTASASHAKAVAGTEIRLTTTPKTGYHFKEWEVISGGVTIKDDKFLMPNDNVEVKAIFEKDAPPAPTDPAKPSVSVIGTYTYNGSEHTATVIGYDSATMDITGNTATDAGDYTVSVTSQTGKWADGSTDAVTAAWSIGKATQEAPTGLIGVAPTTVGGSDGKISGVTDKMEYRMAGERSYTACSGTEIDNLSAGNYFVRYAEDNNHFASSDAAVTVGEGASLADWTITFNAGGGSGNMDSVTVKTGTNYILPECGFTAPTDQEFKAWEISGTEYKVGDTYTVSGDTEIKALWENSVITPTTYTVTVSNDGTGTGTATPSTAVAGTEIILTATPNTGYHFKEWQIMSGGVTIKDDKFLMPNDNVEVKAIFEEDAPPAPTEYTITYDLAGGTAEGNPDTYTIETRTFTLKNPTKSGYTFTSWSGTGLTGENNLTVTIEKGSTGDRSYTAHWRYNGSGHSYSYYTIKATAGAGGSISPSGNVSVREGRDQAFTITPDKGYAVANVKIDGKSIGAVKSYTFENVSRTHTIEVIFMKANGNPQTGVFVDVATGSYYEDAVDWAVENGITKGTDDTHFSPDGICTRAQAVTFLWRAAGSPEPETRAMPFTDVPVGSYYYDAVLWAVENGITKGTSDTTFSPNMTCSRAQIVAFLWRSEKSPAAGTANPFTDVKSTAYYAVAVLWAVKENITEGTTNTTFSPDADCTRAQIVTFLWRCKK